MTMRKPPEKGDSVLLMSVLLILSLGVAMVYSASSVLGFERFRDPMHFLKPHLIHAVIGMAALVFLSRMDYHRFREITPALLLLTFCLLIAVFFFPAVKSSHRSIPIAGQRFQPSELMKLVVILYLAAIFARGTKSRALQGRAVFVHYGVLLLIVGCVCGEPDLGTSALIFVIGVLMFYLSGLGWKRLAQMVVLLIPLAGLAMIRFGYQKERLIHFIGSVFSDDALTYQIRQSFIGLANGGFGGVGFGEGKQKMFFLPQPFTDFMVSSLAEELGFLGILILFFLVTLFLWRAFRTALHAPDRYGYLLAAGIGSMVLLGILVNTAVVVHLLPTTGVPFPFLSYGGSSLTVQLAAVGILLSISRQAERPNRRTPLGMAPERSASWRM